MCVDIKNRTNVMHQSVESPAPSDPGKGGDFDMTRSQITVIHRIPWQFFLSKPLLNLLYPGHFGTGGCSELNTYKNATNRLFIKQELLMEIHLTTKY